MAFLIVNAETYAKIGESSDLEAAKVIAEAEAKEMLGEDGDPEESLADYHWAEWNPKLWTYGEGREAITLIADGVEALAKHLTEDLNLGLTNIPEWITVPMSKSA